MVIRVLFVDDETDFLEQAMIFLEKEVEEFDVETASSPEKGLEMLGEKEYDAVVSDYQMPEMNGLEFLESVREGKGFDIPFIIFTGKGREEVAMKALNLGANRYLQKGGDPRSQYGVLADAILQEVYHFDSEKDLRESEERYRGLFESAQDGMLILNAETGEVEDANPYIQDLTGYSKEELVGRELWEIETFRNIVENRDKFEELVEEGYIRYEDLLLETKEGGKAAVEFVSNTYEAGGEKVVQCNIRDISGQKRAEGRQRERVKELSLLYNLSKVEDSDESLEEILDKAVNLLPDAWQYPEITCARINFEDNEYKTDNFQETEWCISSDIVVEGKDRGFVEVFYLEEKPEEDVGLFLEEEKKLLKEFAERLSSILEKTKIENRLEKSQEITNVGSWEMDLETRELAWSDEAYKIFEQPIGTPIDYEKFLGFIHPEDRDFVNKKWNEALESGEYDIEHRIVVDGETKWVREKVEMRFDNEGEPVEAIGIVQDITEPKERERELKRKEWYLDYMPDFIQVIDEKGNIIYRNRALGAEGVFDKEEIEGSELTEFVHPEDMEKVEEMFTKALENPGEEYTEVVRGKTKDGWAWFQGRIINYLDKPEVEGIIVTGQDITDRKKMEEELRESEERFRKFFEHLPMMAFLLDKEGIVETVNDKFCDRTGYEKQEVEGRKIENLSDILTEESTEKAVENFQKFIEGKEVGSYKIKYETKEGEERTAEIYSVPYRGENSDFSGALGLGRDITEWEEMEEELRESEEKFRSLFESSRDAIMILDPDEGKFISANPTAVQMFRMEDENDFCTRKPWEYSPKKQPDGQISKEKGKEMIEKAMTEGEAFFEWRHERSDGEEFPATVLLSRMEIGDKTFLQATVRDITERKEIKDREDFLHSLLRHDLRNKAQIVQGYLELLGDYDLSEEVENFVKKARKGIGDSMDLIQKVRTLRSIGEKEKVKKVDIGPVMDNVIDERESQAQGKGIKIEHDVKNDSVLGGALLEEVFSNLIENSIKHSDGNEIRISSEGTEDECIIIVEDDGRGIPDEEREKIFERGFTSVGTGGSGLGMYLVKQIVEGYGGSIVVKDSELGGARFDVHLQKT